jgi:thiamine pyrophosphate-dependent acetolactate synthase large subunit-like protein
MENQIEIYQGSDGQTQIEVKFENETTWLTNSQLVELFKSSKANISEHIKNIFESEELEKDSTVRDFRTVQMEGKRAVERDRVHYNLDVIIAVGYRVNSKRGNLFRQWATQRLKDFLVQGYAINETRLSQKQQEVLTLKDGIRILSRAIEQKAQDQNLDWLNHFAKGLELLDDYDHENLDKKGLTKRQANYPELAHYKKLIQSMRSEKSKMFTI